MSLLLLLTFLAPQAADVAGAGMPRLPEASLPMLDAIDPGEYTVGPGDVFWFSVQGGLPAELTGMEGSSFAYLTVTPDGYLVVPTVGSYPVSGLLLAEAVQRVEAGFSSRFPGLRAGAGLAEVRQTRVIVTGRVGTPGMVTARGSDRLTDLLAYAGGLEPDASWTGVLILHPDGDTTEVDITPFFLEGLGSSSPMLGIGDRVHVPRAEAFVTLEGAFQPNPLLAVSQSPPTESHPWYGSVSAMLEYVPGETLDRFVDRAGGTTAWADREACRILRTAPDLTVTLIPAPLDDPSADPELMPGDRVICPGVPPQVAVSGYVQSPGVFPYTAGKDASYYIALAGGVSHEGSGSGIHVILPDGTRCNPDEVDALPAGTTVTVPRAVLVWWQDPLLILTSVATIVIAWKSLD